MCRLAGFIKLKKFKKTDNQWLFDTYSNILVNAESGGSHATGWACVIDNSPVVRKKNIPATEFVKTDIHKELKELLPKTRIVIGHTRFETRGDNRINKNNHPILSKESGLIVAHNGVISNYDELVKKHNIKTDGDVDSEIILRMIETHKGDYEKAFKEMRGSFTFTLLDVANPSLLQIYKHKNDMNFIYVEDKNVIFFATTESHITNELKTYKHNMFEKKISYLEKSAINDTLYTFDLDNEKNNTPIVTDKEIEIPSDFNNTNLNYSGRSWNTKRYEKGIDENLESLTHMFDTHSINKGSATRTKIGKWKKYKLDNQYTYDNKDGEHLEKLESVNRHLRVVGTEFFINLVKDKLTEWKTLVDGFQQHDLGMYRNQLIIKPAETGKKDSTNVEFNMRRNSKKIRKNIIKYLEYVSKKIDSKPTGTLSKKYDSFVSSINMNINTPILIENKHLNNIGERTEEQQKLLNRPPMHLSEKDAINKAVNMCKGCDYNSKIEDLVNESGKKQ